MRPFTHLAFLPLLTSVLDSQSSPRWLRLRIQAFQRRALPRMRSRSKHCGGRTGKLILAGSSPARVSFFPKILRVSAEGAHIFSSTTPSSGNRRRRRTLMRSIFEEPGTRAPANRPAIAQLVEHLTVECRGNQIVPGSIPGGRVFIAQHAPCKSIREELYAGVLTRSAISTISLLSHRAQKKQRNAMINSWRPLASQMTLWPSG